MNFNTTCFGCLIALGVVTLLADCSRRTPMVEEYTNDTLITVSPDTTIDPATGLGPGEYIDPASLPRYYSTYDSLQEFNVIDGIFRNGYAPIDTAVKLYFYAWDFYSEPVIRDGEEFIAAFPQPSADSLIHYRLDRVKFHYDSGMKYSYPPMVKDYNYDVPVFYFKGLKVHNVKGRNFPNSFVKPGSSFTVALGDRLYTFSIEGKDEQFKQPDWAVNFVRNYRLSLTETSSEGKNQRLLLSRKFMPYPGEGDGPFDFISWAGDINDDGYIDVISGDAGKACATYYLWMGEAGLNFKLITRFSGCGC